MIVNGASRCSISFWVKHLENDKKNDRAELREIRGLAAENLRDALLEMRIDAKQTRAVNFFYQANFNPVEPLTEEQWQRTFEIFEKHRGIPEGQARVVFEHEKEGRVHRHVIWSRVDLEKLRAWPDSLDAKVCHEAAREISEELGLSRSVSPFDKDRDGPRPERAPEPYEMFRGLKSGLDPRDIKAEVTRLYRDSQHAAEFVGALEAHGYLLVRGDRRNFCLLDAAGEVHSLARRLDGVNSRDLRSFMVGVEPEVLPSVEQAKSGHRARINSEHVEELAVVERALAWEDALARAAIEKEKIEQNLIEPRLAAYKKKDVEKPHEIKPLRGMSARLDMAQKASEDDEAFAAILDKELIAFAKVTKEEAERSNRDAAFAKAVGNYALRFKDGEIVAITTPQTKATFRRDGVTVVPNRVHRLDQQLAADLVKRVHAADHLLGIEATKIALDLQVAPRKEQREKKRLAYEETKGRPGMSAKLEALQKASDSDKAFAAALDSKLIGLAKVTREEAEQSHRQAAFARAVGNYALTFKEGEIVAVSTPQIEYRRDGAIGLPNRVHKLDQKLATGLVRRLNLPGGLTGIEATKKTLDSQIAPRRREREQSRLAYATTGKERHRPQARKTSKKIIANASKGANTVGKVLSTVVDAFDSLILPKLSPRQIADGEIARATRDADTEEHIDLAKYSAANAHLRIEQERQSREVDRKDRGRDR